MMLRRLAWAALAALIAIAPAQAAYQLEDITCATTATTGTGTVTLGAAVGQYLPFSTTITNGNTVPYNIVSGDGKVETGAGVFDSGAGTLTRSAAWSTDGATTALNLSGESQVCVGFTTDTFTAGVFSPWFATVEIGGASDTTLSRASAGVLAVEGVNLLTTATGQPLDSDLTSWGSVARASGFDTWVATPSSANLISLLSDETGTGANVFGTSPGFTTAANPVSNDGAALGTTALGWADLFLATGGTIHFANTDWVLTHSTGVAEVTTGDLRVTTAGTNSASVATVGGTQTLTNKSIAATQITAGALSIGSNAATVGTVELNNGTDTTLSRGGAGILAVEGVNLPRYAATGTWTAMQTFSKSGTDDVVTMQADNDGGGAGPDLYMFRNSASPASSDNLGGVVYRGKDSGGNNTTYALFRAAIRDEVDTSEDGQWIVQLISGGTVNTAFLINETQATIARNWNPSTDDSLTLGTTSLKWADIFFSEGGVINWDSGDLTLTQTGNSLAIAGGLWATPSSSLTISSDAVTAVLSYHVIDTQSSGATDDLSTINGGVDGAILRIRAANDARTVVIKDGTGNIQGPGDCTLDNTQDIATLIYDSTLTAWLVTSCGNNGA